MARKSRQQDITVELVYTEGYKKEDIDRRNDAVWIDFYRDAVGDEAMKSMFPLYIKSKMLEEKGMSFSEAIKVVAQEYIDGKDILADVLEEE